VQSVGPPAEVRYARSGEVHIAYQVIGDGPPDLVFVMGWVSHVEYLWREPRFARFLRRLASFARLVVFDKRGTGLSDRLGMDLPTLEERMDDVRAVMDAVGLERAALLGISEGGSLCTLFAASYPERTSALVMIGGFPRRLYAPEFPFMPTTEEREAFIARSMRDWGTEAWARRDLRDRAPSAADDGEFARWWATYVRMSASPGAARALTRMNMHVDIRDVLPLVQAPALIVHRTGDRRVPAAAARYMAEHIPTARYVELPGEDHLPFVGDQDAVLDEVQAFLTGMRPTTEIGGLERVLATVLCAEVAGATQVSAGLDRHDWQTVKKQHATRVREEVERYRGRLLRSVGEGVVATFDGPARAIRSAQALVRGVGQTGLRMRAGVHTGECDLLDGDVSGTAVRIAARVMSLAAPGEVLVSSTVRDLVAGSGIEFHEWGAHQLDPALAEARVLQVGGPSRMPTLARHTGRPVGPLTPRELEVATLVARGLTNRQIADALVIAPRTADNHVGHILDKLGLTSRAQIAAWTTAHGLVSGAAARR
jgi:pimeloyl-ACP methyl ester carboxylesterase/DNA-binding CsgD family transcriptional regulator